ncbi:MAG TPA: TIM barrel protein, partial [Pirellulaceae bacterium]|nr:TIM barrel protein [Pirellulaceae bacterium]
VNSPALRAAYDFSHFQLRGRKLAESWATLATQTAFIHVKDATGEPGKFRFLLPGEGTIDYADYFRLLKRDGYRGCVMVEVSGQIWNQPGYDPIAAAKQCYVVLKKALG